MLRMRILGIPVVAVIGMAEPLIRDSGGVARAEGARLVPHVYGDWFMRLLERLSDENHRRYAIDAFNPPARSAPSPQPAHKTYLPATRPYQQRRGRPIGDFWRPGEFDRLLTGGR